MLKKRILILSEGFGTGHTQAAHAIVAGLKRICPQVHCRVLELGSFLNPTVAPWILRTYRVTVNSSPNFVGKLYRQKYDKPIGKLSVSALNKLFYAHAAEVIQRIAPHLIICTHPIPNAIISRLKKSGLMIPLCTVITDYDAHGAWITPEVDRYLVSTSEVKDILVGRNIPSSKVQATGIPVHPDFWTVGNKQAVRAELGIKDMPTALVMGGGWGLLFKDDFIERLSAWKDKIQLICCVGSNEKLAEKLSQHPLLKHENIVVMGYTKEVSKWMDASDLLITKPGGMTCTEGLAKGIPMLFYESIPGMEEKNRDYFIKHGLAKDLNSDELDKWFEQVAREDTTFKQCLSKHKSQVDYEPQHCVENVIDLLELTSLSTISIETPVPIAAVQQRAN
jgi:processive 1,2-diacylglycerol beta-glucosyltransferase